MGAGPWVFWGVKGSESKEEGAATNCGVGRNRTCSVHGRAILEKG